MDETKLTLSILWISVMLTYLLGDVLRVFSGDFAPGQIDGVNIPKAGWLGIAALMVLPIVMVVLSIILPHGANRWANMIMAGFFILFNLMGIGGYAGWYDPFLLVISMVFNGMSIWYAWQWLP